MFHGVELALENAVESCGGLFVPLDKWRSLIGVDLLI